MTTNDARDLMPTRHVVDFEALRDETYEIAYLKEAFELLKETASWVALAGSARALGVPEAVGRNQAVCLGQLVRMTKIMRLVLNQIANDHGGDQQMALSREFLESASTVAFLLEDPTDTARFVSYLHDSLIQEAQLLKTIDEQVAQRQGNVLPIEDRMRKSALNTLRAAGIDAEDVPSRKKNGWPSAETRIKLLGPAAYTAYRAGSSAVHGTWSDLLRNHIRSRAGGFVPVFHEADYRPQTLLMMGFLSTVVVDRYLEAFAPFAVDSIGAALADLRDRTQALDAAHEAFLVGLPDAAPE